MRFRFLAARMLGALAIWLTGCGAFEFGTTPPDMLGQTAPDGAMSVLCDPLVMGSKVKTCWDFTRTDNLDSYWKIVGWDNDNGTHDCWQKEQDGLHNMAGTAAANKDTHCRLTLNIDFSVVKKISERLIIKIEQKPENNIVGNPQIDINQKMFSLFNEITLDTPSNPLEISFSLTAKVSAPVPKGFWSIKAIKITPFCMSPAGTTLTECSF